MDYIVTSRVGLARGYPSTPRLPDPSRLAAGLTGSADFKLINYFSRFSNRAERTTMENTLVLTRSETTVRDREQRQI